MFVSIAKSVFIVKMKPFFAAQSPSPHQIPDGKQDLSPFRWSSGSKMLFRSNLLEKAISIC